MTIEAARPKILVVDDTQANLVAMQRVLGGVDAEVHTAEKGTEALSLMLRHDYALVLLDVQMPGMDGFEVAMLMRENERTMYVPIIFLTAFSKDEACAFKGYRAGAVDYLFKPVDADVLKGKVNIFLELHRQVKALGVLEELKQTQIELERANKELDDFAYIASHDLKEPLRGIHNYATFLIEDHGDVLDDDGRSKLLTMTRLTQRLEGLIDALLHFSRLGRRELDRREVDLNEVLSGVIDLLQPRLEELGVEVRCPEPLPTVSCDPALVSEVLQNLITNAMKYNDKESDRWVELGSREEALSSGEVQHVISVRDNGIGVPEKHRESIFRIFKRLHARDRFGGGHGAGLTIVKKIVQRHGGRVWLEPPVGEGSVFAFTLQPG